MLENNVPSEFALQQAISVFTDAKCVNKVLDFGLVNAIAKVIDKITNSKEEITEKSDVCRCCKVKFSNFNKYYNNQSEMCLNCLVKKGEEAKEKLKSLPEQPKDMKFSWLNEPCGAFTFAPDCIRCKVNRISNPNLYNCCLCKECAIQVGELAKTEEPLPTYEEVLEKIDQNKVKITENPFYK